MGRILIDTRDLRGVAGDLRGAGGDVVSARATVTGAFGRAWLGPDAGSLRGQWDGIAGAIGRDLERVHGVAASIDRYAAGIDAEQARSARALIRWAVRPVRRAATTLRSLLVEAWRAMLAAFRRIAGLLRALVAELARAAAALADRLIRSLVRSVQWQWQNGLEGLRIAQRFIGGNWRTAMKFLHGDLFTGRIGAVWALVKEIPYVGLFASAVMLASDLVVTFVDIWNFASANNWAGRPPTDEENRNAERLKSDLGSVGDIGVAARLGVGIVVTGFDTVNYALANGGMGRPPNDDENRRARQLAEDATNVVKLIPKQIKIGAEAVDAVFGTDLRTRVKPSKWLEGTFDGLFGAASRSKR